MSYISTKIQGNEVLVWERTNPDERHYTIYDAPYYFYIDDVHGNYTTMYNTKVSKVSFNTSKEAYLAKQQYTEQKIRLWESDIGPDLRILSNNYYNVEAPKLNVTHLDIETAYDKIKGYGSPLNPFTPMISCALYHEHTNEMIALVVPPPDSETKWTAELLAQECDKILPIPTDEYSIKYVICDTEKELLLEILSEIENSDLLSGWNCIPTNQSIWTDNKIIKIKDVYKNQLLVDSSVVDISPITTKPMWEIKLDTGQSIQASGEHRFFVHQSPPHKYIDFNNNKALSEVELTPMDMITSNNVFFLEMNLRKNTQPDNASFSCDQLYLAGLIYTDGTLKKKGCPTHGFVIYQSDKEMLDRLPLLTTSLIGPYKDNYSRGVRYSIIADATALIYDKDHKKQLNVEMLSTLSYTQFMSFLSGLLDGDGYVSHNSIEWCNFNNDVDSLFELCLWNGIFSTIRKNCLRFMKLNYCDLTLLKTKRWNKLQPTQLLRNSKQKARQTRYKIIDNKVFIRISTIEQTTDMIEMMDIETDTHWYYSKGIKTHNSLHFDYPYMAGRIKRVLGEHYLRFLSFPEGDKTILEERLVERKKDLNKINEKSDEEIDETDLPDSIVETQMVLETSGRLLADYMLIYKKYEASEKPSYKLSAISDDVLVDENDNPILPKLEYDGSLMDLYTTNLPFFIRYNIRDVEILHGFEKKLGYIDIANTNYHLSCGQFKHVLGTLKLAELAIVNHCHHVEKKVVQNNIPPPIDRSIEGALVLLPRTGLHSFVGSIDIKSLYPSVIMLLNMSNETLIGQFDEEMDACIEVSNKTETLLTLRFEDGEESTEPASTWHEVFKIKNWAISGYGTVFDQNFQGIIPAVLIDWFGKRITFQKQKKQAEKDHNYELAEYYDRLQYVYKIKLNSLYGALGNLHFRFFDLRLGESTTGTGRMILRHQCRKANEILEGEYNIDFPMYDTTKTALKKGYPIEVALDGPKFNGNYQTKSIVYGDSVTGDTKICTMVGDIRIDSLFGCVDYIEGQKEYCILENVSSLTYDKDETKAIFRPIKYVMRHKCSKQVYRVWITDNKWLDVTEDHSLMGYIEYQPGHTNNLIEIKPNNWNNDICSLVSTVGINHDVYLIKPIKIEKIEYNDYVYDIEVEDTHTFFANNILVHNTDSSYFETGVDNVDDAVLVADEVAKQVNTSFPDFVQKTFLVDDKHKHYITTSREVVSDRGIFVEKKRYILHLVDIEGKRVDKLKVMGLDTKKTTLPVPVAKQLNKFIERFLKGETWEEVSVTVVNYKEDLLNTNDIMSIGLPKGVNKIEHYTEEHSRKHSCRLPGHVSASIHYNKCLELFDDRISLPIKSGMKIKVFRLHGKHQGRFTSIAIPTDAEFIPEWFTEEFVIDREAHVERLVDKPLLNILKAIDKKPPTQEILLVQSAWDF